MEKKTTKTKWWEWLLIIMATAICAFSLFIVIGTIGPWYKVLYITNGSMQPTLQPGDLFLVKQDHSDLEVGDIISFQIEGYNDTITHRIVRIDNGVFYTQGDANNSEDVSNITNIRGVYDNFRIPLLGWPASWLDKLLGKNNWASGAWFRDSAIIKNNSVAADFTSETSAPPENFISPEPIQVTETPTIGPTIPSETTASPEETASIEPTVTPEETLIQDESQ